jgi:hypothetical protein
MKGSRIAVKRGPEWGRDLCLRQAGFGRLEAGAPASLRKITRGR